MEIPTKVPVTTYSLTNHAMPASIKSHRTRSSTYGIKLSLPLPDLKDSPSNRELSSYLRPESSQKAGSYLLSVTPWGSGSYLLAASSWAAGSYLIGESSRDAGTCSGPSHYQLQCSPPA
ncbi:hypothetical protein PCASD_15196 [Puccinia coronata f. sp. avenae]|uniref:Uncharacterized protein n=1 Tax=Puccinia coronata f. sp. avenae TaxID=200324 RepID=A0A2N5U0L1_9BASI|nr:hypothetical protein PCASD_15196 [Puccinia coronata f. sp. avenae]